MEYEDPGNSDFYAGLLDNMYEYVDIPNGFGHGKGLEIAFRLFVGIILLIISTSLLRGLSCCGKYDKEEDT